MPPCVIFNPTAKGDRARRFREQLDSLAADAVFRPTSGPGDARVLAAAAVRDGFDTVVAVGGDGTINEVLNGLADVPGGLERAALGILPLGTVNVLARELRIPFSIRAAWATLQAGHRRRMDVFRVEYAHHGSLTTRLAVQLAGAGLDARAVELVDWELKKKTGYLAYVAAGMEALREAQPQISLQAGSQSAQGELVLVGNGRFYGGSFPVFPRASLQDGRLDVRLFPHAGWGTAIACAAGAITGLIGHMGHTVDLQADSFTLTADRRVPLELDGELAGELPARFEVLPLALQVIAPEIVARTP